MDLETLRTELARLSALTEGWAALGDISQIERDLALERLRRIYEMLAWGVPERVTPQSAEPAPAVVAIDLAAPFPLDADAVPEPIHAGPAVETRDFEEPVHEIVPEDTVPVSEPRQEEPTEPNPLPDSDPEQAEPTGPDAMHTPEPAGDPESDAATQTVIQSEPAEQVPADSSDASDRTVTEPQELPATQTEVPEPADEPKQPAAATLFGPEEEIVRHRRKQRVIMSLYGGAEPETVMDNPVAARGNDSATNSQSSEGAEHADAHRTPSEPIRRGQAGPVSGESGSRPEHDKPGHMQAVSKSGESGSRPAPVEPASDKAEYRPAFDAPARMQSRPATPDSAVQPSQAEDASNDVPPAGAVLGEVINHDVQTLSDTIAPPRDMASAIRRSEPVGDLRQAIPINDKFLMIRDLFGGDATAYEQAIDRFEALGDLDECMIYIAEHYAWNPSSDGARLLTDLLERKYS